MSSAHKQIARLIIAFISVHSLEEGDEGKLDGISELKKALISTETFLKPLIKALLLEGSYRLKPPCDSDHPSPHCRYYPVWPPQKDGRLPSDELDCFCGSPVAPFAAEVMADLDPERFSLHVEDAFHKVAETSPVHLPHIWNDCKDSTEKCILNVTTVSENVYDFIDEHVDPGTTHVSASEIRMKLKSRQSFLQVTTDPMAINLDFSETDPSFKCQKVNERMYQLAIDIVEPRRLDFYERYGVKMVFGEDLSALLPGGPFWVYSPLRFEKKTTNGVKEMVVSSFGLGISLDTAFQTFSQYVPGMHYCKVISPARVVEWIYTDSLRDRLGLSVEPLEYVLDKF